MEQLGSGEFSRLVKDTHLVSGTTRELYDQWKFDPETVVATPQFLTIEEFQIAAARAPRNIPDRAARLLNSIHRRTHYFGCSVSLSNQYDCALAYARNVEEFLRLVEYLEARRWIKTLDTGESDLVDGTVEVEVTAEGFAEIELGRRSNIDSDRVFVAMWFGAEVESVWQEGIEPGIRATGFKPIRIDLEQHNDDINDRVKAAIRRSRFLVADFTGHRNGVYLEAGFAMGLGLPVVWMCRKDHFGKSHFDTNHYNHITWETSDEVKRKLLDRIVGTIGFGPLKIN